MRVASENRRCAKCQLVNFQDAAACRRCAAPLEIAAPTPDPVPVLRTPAIGRRIAWLAGVTVAIVFVWSRSLLLTSAPIDDGQRQIVMRAIAQIERAGFTREVLILRHFANFRATDNWWNRHLGHGEAYAATNFPLGVVTLYRPFFTIAVDDIERAAILFHEAQHLWGAGEPAALEATWHGKERLGWTADQYGQTRVWRNTREWTQAAHPLMIDE